MNAGLQEPQVLLRLVPEPLADVVLDPLGQAGDPAQRRLQVVRGDVREPIEVPIRLGDRRRGALGGVPGGLRVGQGRLELTGLFAQACIELFKLRAPPGGLGVGRLFGGQLARLLLRRPARGEVAGDLREAEEAAFGVLQRGDDDVRPELGAVLPNAPPFVLEAALAFGHLQLILRESRLDGLAWIER